MRVALLSMLETAATGLPQKRAYLRVAGRTLAEHQLELALQMQCERIVCMAQAMEPELVALQHEAEAAGARFHAISGPRELHGLLSASDELIVISDGLLASANEAEALLATGPAVFVQPVESGVPAGFERLDLNNAAAGLARLPGSLVESLNELPPDCDVASSLTRIALQSGVAIAEVPPAARAGSRWKLIRDESEAYAVEGDWLGERIGNAGKGSPGTQVARAGVLAFGPSLLHSGSATKALVLATGAAMALGLGWAYLGSIAAGMLFVAMAFLLWHAATVFAQIEAPASRPKGGRHTGIAAIGWLIDLEFIVLLVWGSRESASDTFYSLLFAPVVLILLARLVAKLDFVPFRAWIGDRAVFGLVFAVAAALGILPEITRILAIVLAVVALALIPEKRG